MYFGDHVTANLILQQEFPSEALKLMRHFKFESKSGGKHNASKSRPISVGLQISQQDDLAWKASKLEGGAEQCLLTVHRAKFAVPGGRDVLVSTYPAELNFCDESSTWGVNNGQNTKGSNMVGKALMQVRHELMSQSPSQPQAP